MKKEKSKLVISGNALYEIDLECMKRRKKGEICEEKDFSESKIRKKEKKESL